MDLSHKTIEQARKAAMEDEARGPNANKVEYDVSKDLVVFYFTNGSQFAVPPNLIQGLQGATTEQLRDVWLDRAGLSVHWPSLDTDFSIRGLVNGIFGTKAWMLKQNVNKCKSLFCTHCGMPHVDLVAEVFVDGKLRNFGLEPHRKHLCAYCSEIFLDPNNEKSISNHER